MNHAIVFVVLSHEQPSQIIRLLETLNQLFDEPPICVHHDQSKSSLDTQQLESRATHVVEDHAATEWGGFSLVDATISALKLMQERTGLPNWTFVISGA